MLALDELTELEQFEGDGLAGMGFKSLSEGYPTLLDNLFDQGQIEKKVSLVFKLGIFILLVKGRLKINNRRS